MDTFQLGIFDLLDVNQFAGTPESDFREVVIERVNAKVNLLMRVSVDLEEQGAKRDLPISIGRSVYA